MDKVYDLIIMGGGQSGLACGFFLRRTKLDSLILDDREQCGGAWLRGWDSLTLFSPIWEDGSREKFDAITLIGVGRSARQTKRS